MQLKLLDRKFNVNVNADFNSPVVRGPKMGVRSNLSISEVYCVLLLPTSENRIPIRCAP